MSVIPEKTLVSLFSRCIELSRRALVEIENHRATDRAPAELSDEYAELIRLVHAQKRHDTVLADESWEWIWQIRPDLSAIQIYGRLAWLNYSLVDLL